MEDDLLGCRLVLSRLLHGTGAAVTFIIGFAAAIGCPVAFIYIRHIIIALFAVFGGIIAAPTCFVIYFTKFISNGCGLSDAGIALHQHKAHSGIAVWRLNLPYSGGLCDIINGIVIFIHKAFPHGISAGYFTGAAEFCRKPVAFIIRKLQILTMTAMSSKVSGPPCTSVIVIGRCKTRRRLSIRRLVLPTGRAGIIITEVNIIGIVAGEYPFRVGCIRHRGIFISGGNRIVGDRCRNLRCRHTYLSGRCSHLHVIELVRYCFRLVEAVCLRRNGLLVPQFKLRTGHIVGRITAFCNSNGGFCHLLIIIGNRSRNGRCTNRTGLIAVSCAVNSNRTGVGFRNTIACSVRQTGYCSGGGFCG